MKTRQLFRELDNKTKDICTEDMAKIWLQKADSIHFASNRVRLVLVGLADSLALAVHYKNVNSMKLLSKASSQPFFEEHHLQERVNTSLKGYEHFMMLVDTNITVEFKHDIQAIDSMCQSSINKLEGWNQISCLDAIVLIRQLLNSVNSLEQMTVEFCNRKVAIGCDLGYEKMSFIVSASSTTLQPNEILTIYAGLGEFNVKSKPQITVAGKLARIDLDGVANYHLRAAKKPGKYSVPVSIKFKNPYTGKEDIFNKEIVYTVKE